MQGIIRVEKNSNYTVLHKAALKDTRLSWKAKGIIAYMLSMPDNWIFHMNELMKHSTDGEKSFRSGFNELKTHGYVKRFPVYKEKKIDRWETVVFEVPQTQDGSLLSQNVQVGNEDVRKEALLITDSLLSNDKKNIELIIEYLNAKTCKNFKTSTGPTKKFINGRLAEGYTVDDFKRVIDIKVEQWLHNPEMNAYLRPSTLFAPKNFENYLNENASSKPNNALQFTPRPVELNFNEGEDLG